MRIARSHLAGRARSLRAALILVCAMCGATVEATSVQQASQSDVEAVYLFDFGKFVRWPAGADQGTMAICVAGSPAFTGEVQKVVTNENIGGRPLEVRRVLRPAEEAGCALLFIEAAQHPRLEELLEPVAAKPTLTVSDMPDFLSHGGMIQFQVIEKRVRFSVNLDAVSHAHLTMSSELLKVAVSVKGRSPEGAAQ